MKTDVQLDYKILFRNRREYLDDDVTEWTRKGYRPVGGLTVTLDSHGQLLFAQAVAAETE